MSNAKSILSAKVRASKRASFLNRTAIVMDCQVFVDHAYNVVLSGETEKAHKTFDVLKAMGYVNRYAELPMENGNSLMFIHA